MVLRCITVGRDIPLPRSFKREPRKHWLERLAAEGKATHLYEGVAPIAKSLEGDRRRSLKPGFAAQISSSLFLRSPGLDDEQSTRSGLRSNPLSRMTFF